MMRKRKVEEVEEVEEESGGGGGGGGRGGVRTKWRRKSKEVEEDE